MTTRCTKLDMYCLYKPSDEHYLKHARVKLLPQYELLILMVTMKVSVTFRYTVQFCQP